MPERGRMYGASRVFFLCHVIAALACRDARFCVSRVEKCGNDRRIIASINVAWLLVRRKILRLYLGLQRIQSCGFPAIMTMASACRDARFCVSRVEKRGNNRHFITSINGAWLLVRRKILRLYLGSMRCRRVLCRDGKSLM